LIEDGILLDSLFFHAPSRKIPIPFGKATVNGFNVSIQTNDALPDLKLAMITTQALPSLDSGSIPAANNRILTSAIS